MSSYVLAFGILGFGIGLAAVLWGIPRLRRRREVRRFRQQLTHVDFVALAWRESLHDRDVSDDVPGSPAFPESRRSRRANRRSDDKGGETLV